MSATHDPYDYLGDLRVARCHPDLWEFDRPGPVSSSAGRAARQLAVALGQCRLFGVDPGEWDGVLPVRLALDAAMQLVEQFNGWLEDLERLDEDWMDAADASAAEALTIPAFERRMEATAIWIACWESVEDAEDTGVDARSLDDLLPQLDRLRGIIEAYDELARQQGDFLETVVARPAFAAWRECLVDEWYFAVASWITELLELPVPAPDRDGPDEPPVILPPTPSRLRAALKQVRVKTTLTGSPADPQSGVSLWQWRSPDQSLAAWLTLPATVDSPSAARLKLRFVHAADGPRQGEAATPRDFDGEHVTVQLFHTKSLVSEDGVAEFMLRDPQSVEHVETLRVWIDGLRLEHWMLVN